MILRILHLENYKQYGHLDLEFREGLVGIIGRNGAGKSTLFEAILYCLFGRDESNKLLIRSSFADPKATVVLALQFAIGPVEYAVKREFRGKAMAVNAELYKNDQLIAKGVAVVNEEIGKVLNMEREAFKRSVFSGQTELSELSKAKGEERKRMVRKMLGLDTLDEVQTRINSEARELNSQIAGQRQNLLDPEVVQVMESEIDELNKLLETNTTALKKEQQKLQGVEADYQSARQKFDVEEQKQKRHQHIRQELGRLQERSEGLSQQRSALAKKIQDLQAQQTALAAQKVEFSTFEADKKQLQKLEAERQRQLNRNTNLKQIEDLQEPLRHSRTRVNELGVLLAGKAKLAQTILDKKAQAESLDQQIEQRREAFNAIKSQMDALNARIGERRSKVQDLKTIGREGTCPTCFQPVLDAYDSVLAQLDREIDAMQSGELAALEQQKQAVTLEGQQLKSQQTGVRREIEVLQTEESHLRELDKQKIQEETNLKNYEAQATRIQVVLREIGEVHFDQTNYNALKNKVDATEPRYQRYSNDLSYVSRELPATLLALQQTDATLAETAKLHETRTAELTHTGYDASRYEAAKQALTQFGEAFATQSNQVRTLEKSGMELQNTLSQQHEKLGANARIREQVSAKLEEVELLKKLSELLIQFKTEILERVSPSISREASELFSRITRGKYERIHVDESFDFSIADGGLLYPIERFSGGEVDLANFCLRIAITKAIMDLGGNGQGVEFLAFDEIFGSQDEERRHEMMLALNYLQEQFRQIYIVSHIESQKDYFPNLLEVTYQPEGSLVKWV